MKLLPFIPILALAVATPLAAQPAPAPVLEQRDVETWLDGIVPYAIDAGDIAGAVVTVVADGKTIALKGYGEADVASGRPVDPERTLFRAGSVSKLMTWTAVMQLVEQGRLDLDADVNRYLDFAIPPFEGQPITLRHILTHTAGFEEQLKHVLAFDRTDEVAFEDLVRNFIPTRIFAPGTTPAYSNYATALAGYIVERVSGEDYETYVDRHIFTPLGMDTATFSQDQAVADQPELSRGYSVATAPALPFELVAAAPAGSMTVSAPDMARFMLAYLDEGRLGEGQILEPETVELMHARANAPIPALNGMALGFYESSINGHRVLSHGGDTLTFHSDLNLFVDDGVGIFVSINSSGKDRAAYALRSLLFTGFADRYFPAGETAAPAEIAEGNAQRLVGQWTASRRSDTSFAALADLLQPVTLSVGEDGRLEGNNFPVLGAPVRDWIEVEPLVWQASNSHERLAATIDADGKARFSLETLAPITVYDPVPWYRGANWLLPALLASLSALAITAVQWPAAALVRRRYGARLALGGPARTAYHAVRAAAAVTVLTFAGWVAFINAVFTDLTLLSARTDGILIALQTLTIGGALALGGTAAANAVLALCERRSVLSIAWAIALVGATVVTVWVAFAFNLFKFGTSY